MQLEIFVFKTNIDCSHDAQRICDWLRQNSLVRSCNVALDDCDRVLRVESLGIQMQTIIQYLTQSGFLCEELAD